MEVKDTSKDYDDLVGYIAEENKPTDLSNFLGEKQEYKPTVKPKPLDPEFPEDWQSIYVNFRCMEDYIEFMKLIGEVPGPKIRKLTFSNQKDNGILDFFGD